MTDSALLTLLTREMRGRGGAIPFHEFMSHALYHPEHGYYMTGRTRVGHGGDFVTAPELTSLFGEMMTLQCIEVWQRLHCPQPFLIVEMGGGSGQLAYDLLTTAQRFPPFFACLQLRMVETSPDFQTRQQQKLHALGLAKDQIQWSTRLPDHISHGIILGNEFLDALPVHWVEMTPSGWMEIGVTNPTHLALQTCLLPLSDTLSGLLPTDLPVGYRSELGMAAMEWMRSAGQTLQQGAVIMIDYGEVARDHYSMRRHAGTLVGHYQGERVDDPLLHAGAMDLTAHVDFSAMAQAGAAGGLDLVGFTTQGWFLQGLGILERVEMAARMMAEEPVQRLRDTVKRLLLPDEMGERFKVLVMGRNLGPEPLAGLRLNNQRDRL
ncbi:MAG: hypothetical protein G8237_06580 [Magnetococcales bacterium]|nr:SAM-dependent methyltransferase [Magnetococcales bacterium]NGZ06006.1 hypothetical protein [Magnetococcales bacterium]